MRLKLARGRLGPGRIGLAVTLMDILEDYIAGP